jgi:hypothetical protein
MSYPIDDYGRPARSDPFADTSQARQIYAQARELLADAERSRIRAEAVKGVALWCSAGGHAFSPRDRGRQEWAVKVFDDDAGEMVEETRVCCSRCASTRRLTDAPLYLPEETRGLEAAKPAPAAAARSGFASDEWTAYLEWSNAQSLGANTSLGAYVAHLARMADG